jgi:hypothetical protein
MMAFVGDEAVDGVEAYASQFFFCLGSFLCLDLSEFPSLLWSFFSSYSSLF